MKMDYLFDKQLRKTFKFYWVYAKIVLKIYSMNVIEYD